MRRQWRNTAVTRCYAGSSRAAATRDADSGQSYYVMEAEITGDLSVLGDRGLIPGMPVEVFVETDQQVALAYFVKPFTDQITRAFREE